jgi:hypothetical protein
MRICNICGTESADFTEIGTFKKGGGSGTIGLDICDYCREAAEWHDRNLNGMCVNCGDEKYKSVEFVEPAAPENRWSADVEMCYTCYNQIQGGINAHKTNFDFRSKANINGSWENERQHALIRDGYSCVECGYSGGRLHVHHIIPRSNGGTDHVDNLKTLCPDCHADKHDTQACLLCGSVLHDHSKESATWVDDSGGWHCHFCEKCKNYMARGGSDGERCVICARFTDSESKSTGISFFSDYPDDTSGSEAEIYPACETCRQKIGQRRGVTERYLDEHLPDSHVNVRHWEGSADD